MNGMCIDIAKRCNLKEECPDKSDESFCWTVNIPHTYETSLPPANITKSGDMPLLVYMHVLIQSFDNISMKVRWLL